MVRVGPMLLVGLCACGRGGFDSLESEGGMAADGAAGGLELALGQNASDTYAAVADTQIVLESPDMTYGTCEDATADGMAVTARILIAFDVGGLPAETRVEAAALELRIRPETTADIASSLSGLRVVRLLEAWDEGSVCYLGGAPNWTERRPGVTWAAIGAEPPSTDPTVIGTIQGPLPFDQPFTIDLPADLIEGWRADPTTNFGVAIYADTSDGATVYTNQGPDGTRPRLRLRLAP